MFLLPKSLVLLSLILASPLSVTATISYQATLLSPFGPHAQINLPLIILPLGNSITWGYGSSTGNGYRQPLLTLLAPHPVKFIGSEKSGNMKNNENEGHPGALISQIEEYADNSLYLQPDVILLMAGTNDINNNDNVAGAPERLASLLDKCINTCPNAVLLVAEITPILIPATQARADAFNEAIPGLVQERAAKGAKVLSVNMSAFMTVDDLYDGLHPNDAGYDGMAKGFYEGMKDAASKKWIVRAGSGGNGSVGGNGILVFSGGGVEAKGGVGGLLAAAAVMAIGFTML